MINEHEPLLLDDLKAMFERLVPAGPTQHDDFELPHRQPQPDERVNGHAHCRAALLRTSESMPIVDGALTLGRWQRVFLVEFDGGQRREVSVALTARPEADHVRRASQARQNGGPDRSALHAELQ